MKQLLPIFETITPDNIKNIPVIKDSMKIFTEILQEYSKQSIDIKTVLDENTTEIIKTELPQIYLYDYYSMIQNLKNSQTISDKFKRWNEILNPTVYPKDLPHIGNSLYINYFVVGQPGGPLSLDSNANDLTDLFLNPFTEKLARLEYDLLKHSPENYYINRIFKESKGLNKSIHFIYNILNEYFVEKDSRKQLEIIEESQFKIKLKGSVDKDIYKEGVGYLSHPLGFVYDYIYISELNFYDDFGIQRYYSGTVVKVVCSSGNEDIYYKNVKNIIETASYRKVEFMDNSYLLEKNDTVSYFENENLIKYYSESNHCSIYHDYILKTKTRMEDSVHFSEIEDILDNYPDLSEIFSQELIEEFDFGMVIDNGLQLIGEEILRNDSDAVGIQGKISEITTNLNNSTYDNIPILSDNFSINTPVNNKEVFETFPTIYDLYSQELIEEFDFGMVIDNTQILGEDVLRNDSDAVGIQGVEDILETVRETNSDDSYNISSISEDFSIDII